MNRDGHSTLNSPTLNSPLGDGPSPLLAEGSKARILARGRQTRIGILLLRTGGMNAKQVAAVLRLSLKTVQYHQRRVFGRMGKDLYEVARAMMRPQEWWEV